MVSKRSSETCAPSNRDHPIPSPSCIAIFNEPTNSTIQKGDVVAICMENGAHFVAAWLACAKISQYIGELLRYLLLTEKSPYEENHNVRLLIGNGLRPAIWSQFQERFKVKRIAEFYGSTEGTSNLSKNFG
ncbi:hypothetical protein NECAME_02867 [Necator americanus]|uniref:AMP-dependent synthetase/ligase domain-containing protein n=1 Tax=Necator americanus TaxID=51031 RepID=W2TAV7_NECAM|nr:hypothetical protein NECAME_02867 [Necator americanus]ETN78719.1 hypothetical protein NECAME_02867 [Necator americanus]